MLSAVLRVRCKPHVKRVCSITFNLDELRHRAVRIYQATRNTMQSGSGKSERWRLDWDILPGAGRWENPLMGYASSADYVQGTRITFKSKEDAVHFAEKQGWDYYVQQPTVKRIPPKNYAENYVYKPHTLRIMRTK
ncbi:ETC complex I subunit conserved region-domain-containing protein [Panaeolus papilionaceus]|nr:ETC complex I subunit conserved region-domain-containing protein [Panaeolus papilionaceus]